ncbi:MAG: penicillin-binding protein 2 [Patescibacteria group bacterium]|nr:penicillin-binding protein 2 [Patescibacteria group bacterium]
MTAFLLLLFLIILARLFYLQVIVGSQIRVLAQAQHSIYKKLLPSRGEIKLIDQVSQETVPLATNIEKYLAAYNYLQIQNPKSTAASLAEVLGLAPEDVLAKISDTSRKYVPIKKQLTEDEQRKVEDLKLPGIYFDAEETRSYPQNELLSQVLGFVGYNQDNQTQKVGLYGLERNFQNELAGKSGELKQERGLGGEWIFGGERDFQPAEDGVNLVLTIDRTIQFKAESVLKDAVEKNSADSGSVLVINPSTGAILAMAGYPNFNPNEFNKQTDPKVFMNENVTGNYEPGSVFKPLTMAAAINEGKITPDTTYIDTGEVKVDNFTIKNFDKKARGLQTMTQVLEQSLNTGVIFAKEQMGDKTFFDYIKKFGFGKLTGIELPETKGNLDNLKANIAASFDTATFGQGITITPIQLIQAFTAIANQGKMMKPYLVQSKIYSDGRVENTKPQEVAQVISEKTANTVAAMMVSVIESGHGKKAGVPGYYIAGKTGTAQVAGKDGKYENNNNIGSFIGFGPVENPKFLMLIRVDHPRSVNWAETTAAPAFGEIAQFILNYYQVPPTRNLDTGK